jgi:hypothetical protein
MFGVEEHNRDGNDQAVGSQQGCPSQRRVNNREGCGQIKGIVGHADKLTGAVCG